MEGDLPPRRSTYLPGCMMSPSCFPVQEEMGYTRMESCGKNKRSRRWRSFLRRMVSDRRRSRSIYGSSKAVSFQYDAVSYSQNFDEGCHLYEEPGRRSKVFNDVRWDGDLDR
ncbi:hypothetical protein RchiOBHm_Chr2g0110091 [Rosa chinensis]|uniref:Uncharacterized protein n=1 Tax=Rosa chinensis TaxID=74649 RepID=A0A2P6RPL5_ROSCH|nr:hypothetical protein RchiOBHm_Chr2g0110091 [Rosa chinensis]